MSPALSRNSRPLSPPSRAVTLPSAIPSASCAFVEIKLSGLVHEAFFSNALMPCRISASARRGPPRFVTLNFLPCSLL